MTSLNTECGLHINVQSTVREFRDGEKSYVIYTGIGKNVETITRRFDSFRSLAENTLINRIPDVIQAKPGMLDSVQLDTPTYIDDLIGPFKKQ